MSNLLNIRPTGKTTKQQTRPQPRKVPTLADAPGVVVNNGLTIEWTATNATAEITPAELEKVSLATGVQNLNPEKVRRIKSMMRTMTCAQIVASLKGRKGYAERTVKRYHAALSKSGGVAE